jgi:hypothetical protein
MIDSIKHDSADDDYATLELMPSVFHTGNAIL